MKDKITYRQARLRMTKLLQRMGLSKKDIKLFYKNCKKSSNDKKLIRAVQLLRRATHAGFEGTWIFGYLVLSASATFGWSIFKEGFEYWRNLLGINKLNHDLDTYKKEIDIIRNYFGVYRTFEKIF